MISLWRRLVGGKPGSRGEFPARLASRPGAFHGGEIRRRATVFLGVNGKCLATAGLALLAAAAASGAASGATTATWELTGYADFLRGRMSGLSVTRDGRLTLGPKLEPFFSSDQPNIWSVAQGPDGSLYLGTGNRGRLIKVDSQGHGSVLWTADQSQIFAVAVDRAGVIYAGVSPEGKIYRIENGRATEYFAPGEPYIWTLAIAPDGTLYAGTGQQGKIFRVTGAGRGELYYETGQMHVTALAFDREGRLLAGSEPNGILYRVTGTPARAFVLYDANLPEIRSILTAADGTIYAAALGGNIARRAGAAASTSNNTPTVVAPATSITVTDAQAGLVQPPKPAAPAGQSSTVSGTVASVSSTTEVAGVERSALYRIQTDNTVETLWSSKEENIYDIAAEASGALLLLTDAQGRIYRLDPRPNGSRGSALIAQANEGDATRLLASARGVLAATSNAGKIFRLGTAPDTAAGAAGWFESPIHDAGAVARWGRLHWVGTARGVAVKTRTGNSARPDNTWSDWSAALTDPAGAVADSPNARYIQWRAEFTSASPVPEIDSVTIAYLPQNTAPTVRSITVSAAGAKAAASTTGSASSAFSITVTDTGDSTTAAGTQSQTFSRPSGQQMQISWQADDPEGDTLSYSLYFRGEDEREWKPLRTNMTENSHTVDGDALADGRYFFRVIASDRPSNPAGQARQSELTGAPVLLDSTPPEVRAGVPRRNGAALEIEINAQDRGSALRRCEYSIDAQPWLPVEAADGVTDSLAERFMVRVDNFPQGEHVVAVRVYDVAGNAGLARVVVR